MSNKLLDINKQEEIVLPIIIFVSSRVSPILQETQAKSDIWLPDSIPPAFPGRSTIWTVKMRHRVIDRAVSDRSELVIVRELTNPGELKITVCLQIVQQLQYYAASYTPHAKPTNINIFVFF